MPVLTYKYGALYPTDWDNDCAVQIELQVDFWNKLAKIHRETGDIIRSLTPSTAELEEIIRKIDELKLEQAQIESGLKAEKTQRYRMNRFGVPSDKPNTGIAMVRLKEIRLTIKELAQRRATLSKIVRYELAAEKVILTYRTQQRMIKEARRASAANGLWWGNYNAVMASFDGSRSQIAKTGGVIKEKRYNGEGRLTVQLQGGASPEQLFSSSSSGARNEAYLIDAPPPGWEPRHQKNNQTPPTSGSRRSTRQRIVTLVMTVYTRRDDLNRLTRRVVHVPIVYDRPLPSDCRVQQIVLTRRKGNRRPTGDWRYDVMFILRVPEPECRHTQRAAAIHIGWRKVEDGIRAATVVDNNDVTYFVLPDNLVSRFVDASQWLSRADTEAESFRREILTWPLSDIPPSLKEDLEFLGRARSVGGIGRAMRWMTRNWSKYFYDYMPDYLNLLNRWMDDDLKCRWRARNIQQNAIRHRRDLVRVWISRLAKRYDVAIVQQYDISHLHRKDISLKSLPSGRRNIQRIAPGEIRANVVSTLRSRGVEVISYEKKVTWICHCCGTEIAPHDPLALRQRCTHCGEHWDIDENAARNALAALKQMATVRDVPSANVDASTPPSPDGISVEAGRFAFRKVASKIRRLQKVVSDRKGIAVSDETG